MSEYTQELLAELKQLKAEKMLDLLTAERDQLKAENERLKCVVESKHSELYEEQQRRFEGNRLASEEHHNGMKELERDHTHKIVALTIQVEKLICEKLGREWAASGISIETLIGDLAFDRDTLRTQLAEARELLTDAKARLDDIADSYGTFEFLDRLGAWLEVNSK